MFICDIKNFETNITSNCVISKKIEIDENLTCFIIIDSKNTKIVNPLLNRIVDFILDTIDYKDTYNKFSITLENINFFIKTLKNKENNWEELNIIIAILEKNNFYFSKIWKSSCFLINNKREVLELSDKNTTLETFDYVSLWKLSNNESVILTNTDLNNILTQSDMSDLGNLDDISKINENIIHILNDEKIDSNIQLMSIKFETQLLIAEKNEIIEKTRELFYKTFDNHFSKKSIALYMILKEKINQKWKIVKNIIFFSGMLISTLLLYFIISWVVWKSIETGKNSEYKENLIQAREYIRLANQNISNREAFNLNIKKAEELINTVKEQELFLNDIDGILSDISIMKKQFNGIEIFEANTNNLIFKWIFQDAIKLIELNKKLYVLWKSSIYWPIISWQNIKNNIFYELALDDYFTDITSNSDQLVITTKKWRVVWFTKDGKFKYLNVMGQISWEWSEIIESYNGNLYMVNKNANQIYKHTPSLWLFTAGSSYLKDGDSKNIWTILSLWIDGWIYILNHEWKIFKFFSNPKYRLESIVLNKLPENYSLGGGKINLVTRVNLNYIYLYLNNKIWIFEPNTKIFSDTKSLTYRWQIEWKNETIKGFYIPRDGEINILTENGIHKINFEIKDEKLIVR